MKKLDEFIAKTKKAAKVKGASLGELGVQHGIEAAGEHAERVNPGWSEQALRAVRKVCELHEEFVADDIWDHIKPPANGADPRALGGVMRRAMTLRYCEPLLDPKGRIICMPSTKASQHRNPLRVYRSLLWMPRYKER